MGWASSSHPAGTHPFSRWAEQPVVAKERYRRVVERAQYWGRHMVIFGVHVHVGVDSRDKVLPLIDALTNYGPHLLALSCSSPYWESIDTGYASHRTQLYQQLPTNGLPFHFDTWEQYCEYLNSLVATDVINDPSEDRWDVRPVPRYGTVEMRYCDGMASLPDIAAIVAFTQCLVEYFSRRIEAGNKPEVLAPGTHRRISGAWLATAWRPKSWSLTSRYSAPCVRTSSCCYPS